RTSCEQALKRLKLLPYEDLGFAAVDNHRQLRRGFPEVIFGEGKTAFQIISIMRKVAARRQPVLVTRVTRETYGKIRARFARAVFHEAARSITLIGKVKAKPKPGILVISAGTSDIPVAEEAVVTAEVMGNRVERLYDVGVAGLHRLLDRR